MDEETMRLILEGFTAKIKEDTDQKLELIDSKLNTINNKLEDTNNQLEEVIKKTEAYAEVIKTIQRDNLKYTQDIHTNKNKIHLNDMRIRELEEELEKRNSEETNRLNQLFSTVGVLKAQIANLTNKPEPQPTFRQIVSKNIETNNVNSNVTLAKHQTVTKHT